jgi:hypothetical protein
VYRADLKRAGVIIVNEEIERSEIEPPFPIFIALGSAVGTVGFVAALFFVIYRYNTSPKRGKERFRSRPRISDEDYYRGKEGW